MKPLPTAPGPDEARPGDASSALIGAVSSVSGSYSAANRRSQQSNVHRVYPWLLCASTAIAVVFCVMYITKPILPDNRAAVEDPVISDQPDSGDRDAGLLPDKNHLPGQKQPGITTTGPVGSNPKQAPTIAPLHSIYEETNLRMQHILTAEAPGGHVSRIDLNVPVLYPSRQLRWSTAEVAQARSLMLRLMDYQDKTRQLRSEGQQLLSEWSSLIEQSIPSSELRADSPSLPSNQENAGREVRSAGMTSSSAIQIQGNQ